MHTRKKTIIPPKYRVEPGPGLAFCDCPGCAASGGRLRGWSPSACRAPLWSDPVGARRRRAKAPLLAARPNIKREDISARTLIKRYYMKVDYKQLPSSLAQMPKP